MRDQPRLTADSNKTETRQLLRRERYGLVSGTAYHEPLLGLLSEFGVKKIGAYYSYGSEPDTHDFLGLLTDKGYEVFLPYRAGEVLDFKRFSCVSELEAQEIPGFMEISSSCITEPLDLLDIVIVPCLAVSSEGQRLGQGGGFYDKTFAVRHPGQRLVGLVYPHEIVRGLSVEEHDIRLDYVVTTDGKIHSFTPSTGV